MLPRRFEGPYFLRLQGFLLHSSVPEGEDPGVLRSAGKVPGTFTASQFRSSRDIHSVAVQKFQGQCRSSEVPGTVSHFRSSRDSVAVQKFQGHSVAVQKFQGHSVAVQKFQGQCRSSEVPGTVSQFRSSRDSVAVQKFQGQCRSSEVSGTQRRSSEVNFSERNDQDIADRKKQH